MKARAKSLTIFTSFLKSNYCSISFKGGEIKSHTATDYILKFDVNKHTWSQVGKMKIKRDFHAASVVNAEDVIHYCEKGVILFCLFTFFKYIIIHL